MISQNCRIEEFVENVDSRDVCDFIYSAVNEATLADRLRLKASEPAEKELLQTYSQQLKQLINYHRFEIKPKRPRSKVYNLYLSYWGSMES